MLLMLVVLLLNYILARFSADARFVFIIAIAVIAVLMFLSGGMAGFDALFVALTASVYIGWKFRWSYERLFLVNFLIVFLLSTSSLWMYHLRFELSVDSILQSVQKAVDMKQIDPELFGLSGGATGMRELEIGIRKIWSLVQILYPFLIFLFSTIVALFITPIFHFFWRKYQGAVHQKGDFQLFFLPDKLILLYLVSFLFIALDLNSTNDWSKFLGWNLLLISLLIYFFQGMAVWYFFSIQWKFNKYFSIFIVLAILLLGVVPLITLLAILGTVDYWIDFRKIQNNDHSIMDES